MLFIFKAYSTNVEWLFAIDWINETDFVVYFLQVGMRFLTERGQNVNGQPNIIYVSADNGIVWNPLHEFLDVGMSFVLLTFTFLTAPHPRRFSVQS